MKAQELRKWIDSLTDDIEFSYAGKHGSICPISRAEIYLSYGDATHDAKTIDDAMSVPFFNGKSLNEISDKMELL
jgi:hypothetical protein|uniref:Uncharacterized protein n=1 Tax=Siphoviridae sp. ctWDo30 TaxID=2826360 RepID=A0A8S5N577_9CAUD|nr:MAG TPA: hypothetical protein [Siphoviridae sp. ctWDo30]